MKNAFSIYNSYLIYAILVQRYFSDEYLSTTGKESCYSDAKNAGDIAFKQGFITTDKKTGTVTTPDRWQAYELAFAIKNADKGMPDDLYRALVVAHNHNLITGTESRWEEGLTKGEAINLLTKVYEALGTTTNADRGFSESDIVADTTVEEPVEAPEENTTSGVDSVGTDVVLDEDDYQDPGDTESSSTPGRMSASEALAKLEEDLKNGVISQELYDMLKPEFEKELVEGEQPLVPTQPTHIPIDDPTLSEDTTADTWDPYDNPDLPDYLKGDVVN